MTEIEFKSKIGVELIDFWGGDSRVVQSARVSTLGANEPEPGEGEGLVKFLLRSGHFSPFEHSGFTFRVHAPIFVTRQMLRHRSSQFNEESGRYRELEPVFYVPSADRPVVQVGKTGDYTFEDDDEANAIAEEIIRSASENAWADYSELLNAGTAKEVARMVLPVNLFSTMYMTLNARNLMHFLDLRLDKHSQQEIREVAEHMEVAFSYEMPWTYDAWKEGKNE